MPMNGFLVDKVLSPQSIALVGVSGDTSKATYTGASGVFSNLIKFGYKGKLYPINPKYDSVMDYKSYPSINDLPEAPDLLVIGIASIYVLPILEQAARKNVGGCVVISSGFGENEDEDSKQLQEKMTRLCMASNMRILGPNCLGFANVYADTIAISINALSAGPILPGNVALISQSGALASTWMIRARDKGLGYSYVISSGNEADLDLCDFVPYLVDDPNTRVIAAYIEGIKNPQKFKESAELCWKKGKPLIVYKSGRSQKGAQATKAHTGSIAGSSVVIDAMFEKCRVVSVNSIDQFLDISQSFSATKNYAAGTGIGVVSISGGTGSIIADVAEEFHMKIPDFASDTVAVLKGLLPSFATLKNPLDTTAVVMKTPADVVKLANAIEADPNVDVIFISLTVTDHAFEVTIAEAFIDFYQKCKKPLLIGWFSGSLNREGRVKLQQSGVPCFDSPEGALQYYQKLTQWTRWRKYDKRQIYENCEQFPPLPVPIWLKDKKGCLTEHESKKLLKEFGINSVEEVNAENLSDAIAFAEKIAYPVVLKINSEDIPHKSDLGCVELNIKDVSHLKIAYERIMKNALAYKHDVEIQGILVQEMIQGGVECIIGVKTDPLLGSVLMCGLGGIFVELLKDVTFSAVPVSKKEAQEMLENLKMYKMLDGYRGRPNFDIYTVTEIIERVSRLACCLKDRLEELDINPLMVLETGKGAKVVDALIVLK